MFASIESPLPAPSPASLIAVLAEGASACSGSHYDSNPTLPRPTLPDQIYKAIAGSRGTFSLISPLQLVADAQDRTRQPSLLPAPPQSLAFRTTTAFLASQHPDCIARSPGRPRRQKQWTGLTLDLLAIYT